MFPPTPARSKGFLHDSTGYHLSRSAVLGRHFPAGSPGRHGLLRPAFRLEFRRSDPDAVRPRGRLLRRAPPRAAGGRDRPGAAVIAGRVEHPRPCRRCREDPRPRRASGRHAPGGPFGAGSDGGLAVLADATGVPFCLWQAGENDGVELANEPNSWAMSSLHTTDVERPRRSTAPCSIGNSNRCRTLPSRCGCARAESWRS